MTNTENSVQGKKSIKVNFFWQLGIEITNMLLPLITSPILSRRLGVEAIGVYSYVYSISYYFILLAALGIFQYGTREIALVREDKKRLNEKFSELLYAQLFIGFIVFTVYLIYSIFLSDYPPLFLIQGISLLGSSIILINWLFSGLEEFQIIAMKTMLIRIIGVILIVLFVKNSNDLPIYFLIMSLEPFVGAIVYIYLAREKVSLVKVSIKKSLKHIKGMSLLFIPLLTTYLYSSMDKVMLGKMSSMAQLGFYENATKALIAKNLAVALSTVLVPRMSNLVGQGENQKFNILLTKTINAVFLLTVAFGFGTAAISSIFSVVFWGKDFAECGNLILIMGLTLPAYGLTYVINNQYLVPLKKEFVYIWSTLGGVIINLILNIVLIPHYQAFGAAFSTLITQYIVLITECIIIHQHFSLLTHFKKNFVYIIFGGCMLLTVKMVDHYMNYSLLGLLAEIILGGSMFLFLCIIYWKVSKDDQYISLFNNLRKKTKGNRNGEK